MVCAAPEVEGQLSPGTLRFQYSARRPLHFTRFLTLKVLHRTEVELFFQILFPNNRNYYFPLPVIGADYYPPVLMSRKRASTLDSSTRLNALLFSYLNTESTLPLPSERRMLHNHTKTWLIYSLKRVFHIFENVLVKKTSDFLLKNNALFFKYCNRLWKQRKMLEMKFSVSTENNLLAPVCFVVMLISLVGIYRRCEREKLLPLSCREERSYDFLLNASISL
jgi:hypothetical protein